MGSNIDVEVDAAARIKAPCAAPSKLREALPPLASTELLGVNDGLVFRLYISEPASWHQPDLLHKRLVIPEQIFFIHNAILPVPDSAHY